MLNAGLSVAEAQDLIRTGLVDAVAFGRLWISHPDMQRRVERGVALDVAIVAGTVGGREGVDPRRGYTDYPVWEEEGEGV